MPISIRRLITGATASCLLLAGSAAASWPAASAAASAADHAATPVSRFVAWQACEVGVWKWIASNAAIGTSVDTRLNSYRPGLEWRQQGAWFVQIAGHAHEAVTATDDSSFCLVRGTEAHPRIAEYAYPR